MPRFLARTARAEVRLVEIALDGTDLSAIECLHCGQPLDIHQPDGVFPDRMLGTCHHCHDWFLWDFHEDHNHAVMVQLPDRGFFREVVRPDPP